MLQVLSLSITICPNSYTCTAVFATDGVVSR